METSGVVTEGGPRPEGEPGALARIAGVFFSPGKTFESIARKPGWVFPVALLLLWALVSGYMVTSRLDVDAIMKKQTDAMEKQGRTMTAEQAEKSRSITAGIVKFSFLIGVAWFAILLFGVPAIYHALTSTAGKAGKYLTVVSAYAYAQMVQIVKGILFLAVTWNKTAIDPEAIPSYLKSNPGAFVDPHAVAAPIRALLSSLDVFDLWGVALCIVALPRVTRVSPKTAAMIVIGAWAAFVLLSMLLATIGAAFGG